jgi:hypothetical protein
MSATKYRLADNILPIDSRFDAARAAFRSRGIADYANARPPRSRNRFVQVFVMLDGAVVPADSRVVAAVMRESRAAK